MTTMIQFACRFLSGQDKVYIASVDVRGRPHLAVSKGPVFEKENLLVFEEWFCPSTIENVRANPRISIAVIDSETSWGYQAEGTVRKVEEISILDGYAGPLEEKYAGLSQVRWRLIVGIDSVLDFSAAYHRDTPLSGSSAA